MKSKINSVKAALKYLGTDPDKLPVIKNIPKDKAAALLNDYYLWCVVEAKNRERNGGKHWEPNWNDPNEAKWNISWVEVQADEKRPSGFGLSRAFYAHWYSYTHVGSRLSFISRETMDETFNHKEFKKLFVGHYLIQH